MMSGMKRLAAIGLGLLLALGLAEAGVRASGLQWRLLAPLVPLQVSDPELYEVLDDPVRLYGLKPGLDLTLPNGSPWTDAPRHITTNALALRDPERPAGFEGLRILCVGGSHTFGPSVSDGETWPAQLEGLLRARGLPAEVRNAGVSGYMNRQKVALAEQLLAEERYELVLFQVFNEGRRFVLLDTPLPWRFATAPGLWPEYLADAPEPGQGPLFYRSALVRLLFIARHRLQLRDPETDPTWDLIERARALDAQALVDFIARGPVPVLALTPPRGSELPSGVEAIDLHALEQPFGEEGLDIHPGPRVYAWEAARILEALDARWAWGE